MVYARRDKAQVLAAAIIALFPFRGEVHALAALT
ncbi:uncharacterized protein G2W53_007931 [Senna tora]|uniref:Uncharacterized protein n=1 Tax=Senna tora TaxID=362788 RepID=A0A834X898_9FABA|nr:uncharacterized protein G2W53_007931 [Senna tora]